MKIAKIFMSFCMAIILSLGIGFGVYVSLMDTQVEQNITVATESVNKQVQRKLKNLGYYTGGIDGIIGPKSKTAIKKFQRDYGLVVDGIIGPKTLAPAPTITLLPSVGCLFPTSFPVPPKVTPW